LYKQIISIVAASIVAAVVVAGCGSSGDSSTDSTATVTKAAFIKQGDTICTKGNEGIQAGLKAFVAKNHIGPEKEFTKELQEEAISTVALPSIQKQAEEIAALGAPSGDEQKIDAIVKGLEAGVEEAEEEPLSLNSSSRGGLTEANKLAQEYGFKVCGQNF
jgi:hypothetical protein